jgi:hypothetical protein
MSDLYEAGFIIDLGDDLSEEIHQILTCMIAQSIPGVEVSGLDHPFFHVEGYERDWGYLIENPRDNDEEMLGEFCGSVLIENRLAFRGLIHDDPFWNMWDLFVDWLSSISFPSGLIGYYRNIFNDSDEVTLILFEPEGVCSHECEDYSEFEELQSQIVEILENSRENNP